MSTPAIQDVLAGELTNSAASVIVPTAIGPVLCTQKELEPPQAYQYAPQLMIENMLKNVNSHGLTSKH